MEFITRTLFILQDFIIDWQVNILMYDVRSYNRYRCSDFRASMPIHVA